MRRFAMASLVLGLAAFACSSPQGGDDGFEGDDAGPVADATQHGDSNVSTDTGASTKDTGVSSIEAGGGDAGAGDAEAGGTTGCQPFAEGLNVAWLNFASDVPNPAISTNCPRCFDTLFSNTFNAGGRVVRWWFHTNGTITPGYDANGMALPISASDIADVKSILDSANAAGVEVNISLWSFDMLQGANESIPDAITSANMALLTEDANRQAYLDNVLTPLVTALKGYPGLFSWEVFNEPEGMTTQHGWVPAANQIDESVVQKNVNWFADAIHQADPSALVTNGTWTFIANSTLTGYANEYSDTALLAAGGKALGTLDFYEVHYYDADGAQLSPFTHPASFWKLDKNVVIGEFWPLDTSGVAAADLYTTLYAGGYYGGWAWQYANLDTPGPDAATDWPAMQQPMMNLYDVRQTGIQCTAAGDDGGAGDATVDDGGAEAEVPEAGDEPPPPDTGTGTSDAGVDTGSPVVDSGSPVVDSGSPPIDSGSPGTDAGAEGGLAGCAPGAAVITMTATGNSGNFGTTGPVCITFQSSANPADGVSGWNASNIQGRTVTATGSTTQSPAVTGNSLGNQPGLLPGPDGFIYWNYTGGTGAVAFASMSLF
jgi:hypothetical protein